VPIYEFVCENCGRIVERLQKVTDPPPEACPECGGKMAKIMSRNSFQLKGGGWYKDLYSSGSKSSPSPGTSAPSSDTTPAATPSPSTGGNPPSHAPNPASPASTSSTSTPASTPKKTE
jgi:putative FmdB family regulatory protein